MDGWMADPNPQGILKEIHPVIPQIDLIFASAALMLSCPDMICAASACYSFFFFFKKKSPSGTVRYHGKQGTDKYTEKGGVECQK